MNSLNIPITSLEKEKLELCARHLRGLTLDAIFRAGSGHAGLPLGCAELGVYLYSSWLRHVPSDPTWYNRDRFILSAGHGSLLLYCCLHFSGYDLSIEDIKKFRSFGSKTPSHPQVGTTPGVEATTGVDGQGVGFGAGQALALKMIGERLDESLFDAKVVVLAGDGCLMEGVACEASALAGHLNLNNLIVIFDSNETTLDGFASEISSEDIEKRYRAIGWDVYTLDGHDFNQIDHIFTSLRNDQSRPTLIIASTTIGRGLQGKSGTPLAHGGKIGRNEWREAKRGLGFEEQSFEVDQEVYEFFNESIKRNEQYKLQWEEKLNQSGCRDQLNTFLNKTIPSFKMKFTSSISGRGASHQLLQQLAQNIPSLIGGSADLSKSDGTHLEGCPIVKPGDFSGKNIKFGVREFAMGAMACGMALTNFFIPFIGTFLAFSDYMRSAIRMSALMKQKVIYQLTHDSIFIGQDGPTHQPVEQLMSLRLIPQLLVVRPADANEVLGAWKAALDYEGPTALILSRQPLPTLRQTDIPFEEGVAKGAYWIKKPSPGPGFVIVASGSEVQVALQVCNELAAKGFSCGLISMPSWELFENQKEDYRRQFFEDTEKTCVAIEAGRGMGWEKYVGRKGLIFSVDDFGMSAKAEDVATHFGLTVEQITKKIKELR